MRFGIMLIPYDRWPALGDIAEVTVAAESFGFSDVVFGEHLFTPANGHHDALGVTWPELYTLSGYLAARTERIRFTYNATVIPLRHPIHQANQIATLDQLSKGRLTLVTGVGWLEEEFAALGLPFNKRGAIADEYMRAMRAIWTNDVAEFHGDFVDFEQVSIRPKCFQQPTVRTLIGGIGKHTRRRIVEYGDGWGSPTPWPTDKLGREIERIRRDVSEAGRDPDQLIMSAGLSFGEVDRSLADAFSHVGSIGSLEPASAQETVDLVGEFHDMGFTDMIMSTNWNTPADFIERLDQFRTEIMCHFQGT
jgi:probable F420-dependent oxidoreductase